MRDEAEISTLRRKAGAGRPATGLAAMTPAKALRLAVARAGEEVLRLPVAARDIRNASLQSEDLVAALPDPSLIVQIDGPDHARGLAALCPVTVAALIEAQTLGRVLASPAPKRSPTRTDKVLVADFLHRVLECASALLDGASVAFPITGFTLGAALADARGAAMVLRDAPHLHVTLDLDFAGGAKTGVLHLIAPTEPADRSAADGKNRSHWQTTLQNAVLGTSARLEAELCKLRLPLSQIAGLAVGDMLRLSSASLETVALKGPTGKILVTGKLGRSGAMRALRLNVEPKRPPPGIPAAVPSRPGGPDG